MKPESQGANIGLVCSDDAAPAPPEGAFAPPEGALAPLVESLIADHRRMCDSLLGSIQGTVDEAASINPAATAILPLRHKVLSLGADMRRLFDREEHGVFPMLLRLETVRVISRCHAGMVRSRVRFAAVEHKSVESAARELRELAESLLEDVSDLRGILVPLMQDLCKGFQTHVDRERNVLFVRAVALEDALVAKSQEGE